MPIRNTVRQSKSGFEAKPVALPTQNVSEMQGDAHYKSVHK